MNISYPTVLKAFHLIRQAIVTHARDGDDFFKGEVKVNQTYFEVRPHGLQERGTWDKVLVFGIFERKGHVKVEALKETETETILSLTVKTDRRDSIIDADKFGIYDALMFSRHKHLQIDQGKKVSRSRVFNNAPGGFWSYAKERMSKFHGVSKEKFPFYLKEMEFRYNHRHEPMFDTLVHYLCDIIETKCGESNAPSR